MVSQDTPRNGFLPFRPRSLKLVLFPAFHFSELIYIPDGSIGDWYPERNLFQILIALTAGRLLLILIAIIHSNSTLKVLALLWSPYNSTYIVPQNLYYQLLSFYLGSLGPCLAEDGYISHRVMTTMYMTYS